MKRWKRELIVMAAITAALWLLLLVLIGARAAATGDIRVTVSPSTVDRYQVVLITVQTSYPNTTFDLTVSGETYVMSESGRTNPLGIWEQRLNAALDFGSYDIDIVALNQTAKTSFTVGCSARCVVDIQNTWGLYNAELIANGIFQIILVMAIVLLVVEGPKAAHYFWKQGDLATKRGRLTARDALMSPLAFFQGFVQPGRQSMKADVNDRIALDLERRALLEELHDATRPKFLEYDPDHRDALRAIFTDLLQAYDREARIVSSTPPIAHKFERGVRDLSTAIEFAETEAWLAKAKEPTLSEKVDAYNDRMAHRRQSRRLRIASALFVGVGLPGGLMALLGPLAYMGVYVEPLRPLWNPVFGDLGKFLIGVALFLSTLIAVTREAVRRGR